MSFTNDASHQTIIRNKIHLLISSVWISMCHLNFLLLRISVQQSLTPSIYYKAWFDPAMPDPYGYADKLQPLQDNPPLSRHVNGSSKTPQRYVWDVRSEGPTDCPEPSDMPKTGDFAKDVSSSVLSSSPRYISIQHLNTSVHTNGKERAATERSDLKKDIGGSPAPSLEEPTETNPRHYCPSKGCTKDYRRLGDLKRHQKKHGTSLWYCG